MVVFFAIVEYAYLFLHLY
ncbi:TPA: hypothetical protein ACH9MQ_001841 [Escherichia coli]